MSFTIHLYNNKSDKNVVDKNITKIATMTGTLKEQCSIVTPEVFVSIKSDSHTNVVSGATPSYSAVLKNVNYFYIPDFERYYYKTDMVSIRSGLWLIKGKSDPLTSFAEDIKQSTGILQRSEKHWNLYIDDGSLKTYNNPKIVTKPFPNSFSGNSYVFAVAGS